MKWLVLVFSILIINSVAITMHKRLKISEIYTTVNFALIVCAVVDVYARFRYKPWGFFDVDKVEYSALLVYLGIYPAVATIILNMYLYQSKKWRKILYLFGIAVFSTAFEWLSLKVGIRWHNNWNLFYSFVMYLFIYYVFLIFHSRIYQWLIGDK